MAEKQAYEYAIEFLVQGPGDFEPHPCRVPCRDEGVVEREIDRLTSRQDGFLRTDFRRLRRPRVPWEQYGLIEAAS